MECMHSVKAYKQPNRWDLFAAWVEAQNKAEVQKYVTNNGQFSYWVWILASKEK